jgi:hypothetical protein
MEGLKTKKEEKPEVLDGGHPPNTRTASRDAAISRTAELRKPNATAPEHAPSSSSAAPADHRTPKFLVHAGTDGSFPAIHKEL